MAKVAHQNKAQISQTGNQALVEQNTVIDDSIIPSAEELAKLKEVDPSLVAWVMERCEKEQDFRHEYTRNRVKLTKKDLNGNMFLNFLCVLFAFLLIAGVLLASVYMLVMGINVAGTLFAGGTIVAAAALFTRIPKNNGNKKK